MLLLIACAAQGDSSAHTGDTGWTGRDLGDAFSASKLQSHVSTLASDEMAGRAAGSAGDLLAVDYVVAELEAAGFEPVDGAWTQPFDDSEGTPSLNVLGVRWGADPQVGGEIVVIGAHHDHLGTGDNGAIYAGANDNASGVAVLLGLAQAFGQGAAPDRTLVLASWGSEEVNIDGSWFYVQSPPDELPLSDTVHYVNLDMVGTYGPSGALYALDAVRGSVGREVVEAEAARSSLEVELNELGELSDSVHFCEAGVPEIFFFTEDPDCYHRPCDTADRLDYDDMAAVGTLVGGVVDRLLSADVELAEQRAEGCPAY